MPKWDYCLLKGVTPDSDESGLETDYPRLFAYTSNGVKLVNGFYHLPKDEKKDVAKAIYQLGEDGWELVCAQGSSALWFKRPKA